MESRNILVMGYDSCAITFNGTNPTLLSQPLVDEVKKTNYAEFYACTHRAYALMPILWKHALQKADGRTYTEADIKSNYPTYRVTENFSAATGLRCLGVSTLDDVLYQQAGDAYRCVMEPAEKDHVYL